MPVFEELQAQRPGPEGTRSGACLPWLRRPRKRHVHLHAFPALPFPSNSLEMSLPSRAVPVSPSIVARAVFHSHRSMGWRSRNVRAIPTLVPDSFSLSYGHPGAFRQGAGSADCSCRSSRRAARRPHSRTLSRSPGKRRPATFPTRFLEWTGLCSLPREVFLHVDRPPHHSGNPKNLPVFHSSVLQQVVMKPGSFIPDCTG